MKEKKRKIISKCIGSSWWRQRSLVVLAQKLNEKKNKVLAKLTPRLNNSKNGVIDRIDHIDDWPTSRPAGRSIGSVQFCVMRLHHTNQWSLQPNQKVNVYSMHVPCAKFTRTVEQSINVLSTCGSMICTIRTYTYICHCVNERISFGCMSHQPTVSNFKWIFLFAWFVFFRFVRSFGFENVRETDLRFTDRWCD